MLVSPLRIAKTMADLTFEECADLFNVVRKVGDAVKTEFKAKSLTVNIQDGPDSGQSVEVRQLHKPTDVSSVTQCLTSIPNAIYTNLHIHGSAPRTALLMCNASYQIVSRLHVTQ